ncbi:hypothetical protein [Spirosoma sp.]|uniref:hypothetical protein n=1 Tax=Spirosoma sp. TaxID=1899569 RepID=UPI002634786C|nr:hypothetical protein [Spirosoma sp.]MCX6216500.1 hypothetical protein [Spirosoma sp.]
MKKLIFLLLLIAVGQGQAQSLRMPWRTVTGSSTSQPTEPTQPVSNSNIVTLTITYASAPTSPTATFAPLKYNKQAWFQYERDDLLSATWTDYQFFQGKTHTDGAGNAVKWRGSTVVNARSNFNNGDLWGIAGKLTAAQIATMVRDGKWGVLNHGYYHDTPTSNNFYPPSSATYSQAGWDLAENQKFTYDKLKAEGVEYAMRGVVLPSSHAGFVRGADSLQYLGITTTAARDGYTGYPTNTAYNPANDGANFLNEESLPVAGTTLFGNTGFVQYTRNLQDSWNATTVGTLKAQFVDLLAKSNASKHLGMRLATHSGTYPEMSDFFNYADSVAADRVWFAGMTEQLEYREMKRLAQKSQALSGNTLTVSLDVSSVPSVNRFRDMSLLVGGGTITSVTATGAHDRMSYNPSTGLINIFWEKTTVANPDLVAAGSTLAIVGPDSVAEGASGSYQITRTTLAGTTSDVTASASLSASRGMASGLTITPGSQITLANATNVVKGDHRITTLTASYQGKTVTREIVLKDATGTPSSIAHRMVTADDISMWPQMKLGDLIVPGATFGFGSATDHSIQIRTSRQNAPTLAPGSTIWVKGADYVNVVIQLDSSRTTDGQAPIQIRNYDGQVKVLNSLNILGAQGLLLSGRYDPVSGAGDSDYRGHEGNYPIRADRYGFLLDNRWTDSSKNGLVMDGGCQRVESEFMELRGGYFAPVFVNGRNYDMRVAGSTVCLPYKNMKYHDLYIHDSESEGFYMGNTAADVWAKFDSLEIYNNVIVRAGTEAIQVGQLHKGTRIHHNVAMGNLNAKNAFKKFQDNSLQTDLRQGGHLIEKNLFIRGGEKFINGQSRLTEDVSKVTLATDTVLIRRNAFLFNTGLFESYYNTTGGQTAIPNLTFAFQNNWFGHNRFVYNLIYPTAPRENFIMKFEVKGANSKVIVTGNTFDGSSPVTTWVNNTSPGNTTVTESGNTLSGTVPHPEFVNTGFGPNFDFTTLEFWTDKIGNSSQFPTDGTAKGTLVTVPVGEFRSYHGIIYESKAANNTAIRPGYHVNWRDYWNLIYWDRTTGAMVRNPTDLKNLSPIPPDKYKLVPGSFYQQQGLGPSF